MPMGAESHPSDDAGDSGPVPESVTPLSFFFPELNEDEARLLDGETARIMERRARVMALHRRGLSVEAIRAEIGCSVGTVHHDIHTVFEGYKRFAARSAQEHIADALQRLAAREVDIEREWERSKGDQVESTQGKRDGKSPGGQVCVKKRQRYGDP